MEFRNHTPFPALAFEGIDQHDNAFHVVVLRQTLSYATGQLIYADEQAPLCEVDEFWGEMNHSSVRQESDLCQYKPKCDVIVNGTAYAPRSQAVTRFDVRLQVYRPGPPRSLPEAPQGLNQRMTPSTADLEKWQRAVAKIKAEPPPVVSLIDKTLSVCGERHFEKQGLLSLGGWQLSTPKTVSSLPLRYEFAFGGQCRVDPDEAIAKRVAQRQWLTKEQCEQHPDQDNPPLAHTVYEPNLLGRGFVQAWYLDATEQRSVAAPQIEDPKAAVTSEAFMKLLQPISKSANPAKPAPYPIEPASFGIRAKTHPKRRALLGTVDQAFIESKAWLPEDFDFAIWNAAPEDQQTEHLQGDETIELTNLCQANTPCCTTDAQGNTHLTLTLPADECYVQIRMKDGLVAATPLAIDTVLIEPDSQTLTLVWRAVLAKRDDAPIALLEACMTPPGQIGGRNPGGLPLPLEERAKRLTEQTISRILNAETPVSEVAHG